MLRWSKNLQQPYIALCAQYCNMVINLLLHGKNRSLCLYACYMLDGKYIENSLIFVCVLLFGAELRVLRVDLKLQIEQKDNLWLNCRLYICACSVRLSKIHDGESTSNIRILPCEYNTELFVEGWLAITSVLLVEGKNSVVTRCHGNRLWTRTILSRMCRQLLVQRQSLRHSAHCLQHNCSRFVTRYYSCVHLVFKNLAVYFQYL